MPKKIKLTAKDYTYDHQAFKEHQLPTNFTVCVKRVKEFFEASVTDGKLVYIGLGKNGLEALAQLQEVLDLVAFRCLKNRNHCLCRLTRFCNTGNRSRALQCCHCLTKVLATRI